MAPNAPRPWRSVDSRALCDLAMDAWPWACGDESTADASRLLELLRERRIPGPRWRARLRAVGVPRLVIRALARRWRRSGEEWSSTGARWAP